MPRETKLYPKWAELLKTRRAPRSRVYNPPAAVAAVRYEDFSGVEAECAGFRRCLQAAPEGEFLETFMTAASPGVVTTTMMNHHYREPRGVPVRGGARDREGVPLHRGPGVRAPDRRARPRHGAGELLPGPFDSREFQERVVQHIEAINVAIEGIPRDRVRLHSCWGNRDGPHTEDVALEHVLPHLLEARVGGDLPAVREPAPLARGRRARRARAIPGDLVVVVGVIESTNNYVEHPEVVKRRILEAATRARGPRAPRRGGGLRLRDLRGRQLRGRGRGLGQARDPRRGGEARLRGAVVAGARGRRRAAARKGRKRGDFEAAPGRRRGGAKVWRARRRDLDAGPLRRLRARRRRVPDSRPPVVFRARSGPAGRPGRAARRPERRWPRSEERGLVFS